MPEPKKRLDVLSSVEKELYEVVAAYRRCAEQAAALDAIISQRLTDDLHGVEATFYMVRSLRQGAALDETRQAEEPPGARARAGPPTLRLEKEGALLSARRPPSPEWVKWLRLNGHDLGALTGTDRKALGAIAGAWELYAYERKPAVLLAIAILAQQMQPGCRVFARKLIPYAMDWGDEAPVWRSVLALAENLGVVHRAAALGTVGDLMKQTLEQLDRLGAGGGLVKADAAVESER